MSFSLYHMDLYIYVNIYLLYFIVTVQKMKPKNPDVDPTYITQHWNKNQQKSSKQCIIIIFLDKNKSIPDAVITMLII